MSDIAIRVENLGKLYRIGSAEQHHDSLREALVARFGRGSRPREDENLWALRDVSFEVRRGEIVGVIGRNGAGKSTLLKVLSRITEPTSGRVEIYGRVGSLLEVGTGFHPELTGRENIYLSGAILGMKRSEIERRFDEIVAFSEIERFLDTPVKRYSSGMYVRLAFSVAAHLEPDVLLVDEVLAVGDAAFQKKCLGKMKDVSRVGRTVLFVSHNLTALGHICERGIYLEEGTVRCDSTSSESIQQYLHDSGFRSYGKSVREQIAELVADPVCEVTDMQLTQGGRSTAEVNSAQPISVMIAYRVKKPVYGLRVGFDMVHKSGTTVFRAFHDDNTGSVQQTLPGNYRSIGVISPNLLAPDSYSLTLSVGIHSLRWIVSNNQVVYRFNVTNLNGVNSHYADTRPGIIMPRVGWETVAEDECIGNKGGSA